MSKRRAASQAEMKLAPKNTPSSTNVRGRARWKSRKRKGMSGPCGSWQNGGHFEQGCDPLGHRLLNAHVLARPVTEVCQAVRLMIEIARNSSKPHCRSSLCCRRSGPAHHGDSQVSNGPGDRNGAEPQKRGGGPSVIADPVDLSFPLLADFRIGTQVLVIQTLIKPRGSILARGFAPLIAESVAPVSAAQ